MKIAAFALGLGVAFAAHAQEPMKSITITPGQIKWNQSQTTKGSTIAILHGHPAKPGVVVTRVRYEAGTRVLPHSHAADSYVVVLKGTLRYGEGATFDEKKIKAYPVGTFILEPAKVPHYWYAKEAVEFQAFSNGPSSYDFVDPKADPRKK